jgi:hypothetical protein
MLGILNCMLERLTDCGGRGQLSASDLAAGQQRMMHVMRRGSLWNNYLRSLAPNCMSRGQIHKIKMKFCPVSGGRRAMRCSDSFRRVGHRLVQWRKRVALAVAAAARRRRFTLLKEATR